MFFISNSIGLLKIQLIYSVRIGRIEVFYESIMKTVT